MSCCYVRRLRCIFINQSPGDHGHLEAVQNLQTYADLWPVPPTTRQMAMFPCPAPCQNSPPHIVLMDFQEATNPKEGNKPLDVSYEADERVDILELSAGSTKRTTLNLRVYTHLGNNNCNVHVF